MSDDVTALRRRLRAKGFAPIPVSGKIPALEGWQLKHDTNDAEIGLWAKLYPYSQNTGILTRLVPTLDIDILNPEAAAAVEALARERLDERGYLPVRFGRSPKRALPFRTDEPFKKIGVALIAPGGDTSQKLELLSDGQQVVVAGIHPDTNKPYGWHGPPPGEIGREELAYIVEAEARALIEDAAELLVREYGYQRARDIHIKANGPDTRGTGPVDWGAAFTNIINGVELHDSARDLMASMIGDGMSEPHTVRTLHALFNASSMPHDERWQERVADIGRSARTATEKFAKPEPPPTNVFDPWQQYVVPDFPVDILPPIARDFVCAQSEIIGCDVAGLAMSVLATFSGALHHGHALRMLRNGSWWASPRLWILLVGPPSSKKTPTFNAATDPLLKHEYGLRRKYEQEKRDFEKAQAEGDESWPEPEKPPRYISWDSTVEALGEILARNNDGKGILVKSDELSGWLSNMERYSNSAGRSDRAFWLQAYDGGPHAVDRIKRGEFFIENLSVSIVGGIQPERLAEIRAGLSTDGLLQRFLPTMLRSPSFPVDRPYLDEDYIKLVCALIFALPQRLIMTDSALAVMAELRQHLFDLEQLSGGLAVGFDSFVGKLPGVCGTLALILHMAHDPKDGAVHPVGERTARDVKQLVLDFILPHALEFYLAGTAGDHLRRIASWILASGATRVLASDLTRKVHVCRGLGLADINKSVAPLVAAGWLKAADNSPACKSWEVEPLVHVKLAARAATEKERRAAMAMLLRRGRRG
jgi:hypothetical protein